MRFDEDAKLVEKASGTNEGKLRLEVGNIAKFGSKLGYEVSKLETRGNEIEIKLPRVVTPTEPPAVQSWPSFLAGRRGLS